MVGMVGMVATFFAICLAIRETNPFSYIWPPPTAPIPDNRERLLTFKPLRVAT
jgi:uncharacterized membrane-anchored protein YjiN (DUF445 family)